MFRNEEMPMMQSLETRQMLSVTLLEGVLSVEGTDGDDAIVLSIDNTVPETPALVVTVNGVATSNALSSVTSIVSRSHVRSEVLRDVPVLALTSVRTRAGSWPEPSPVRPPGPTCGLPASPSS